VITEDRIREIVREEFVALRGRVREVPMVRPICEGSSHKGGLNLVTQITERPAPPPRLIRGGDA
jgi:hypothetical protein